MPQALVLHAPGDLRLEERPAGDPGPGQVRVRMAVGGICGSDLHYFNHGGFGAVRLREPMILGHEVAGHVEALGERVEGLSVGQLVAVSPSRPCGCCAWCLEGAPNHCENMRFYGSAMPFPHIQGAFREVLVADATQCVPADGLSAAEAAMVEPLAVCLHAMRRAGEMLGRAVLVTGCGPIGILSILAARRAGADLIVATDLEDLPLRMAREAGADVAIRASEGLDAYAGGKGRFDVLFECSGAEPALRAAIPAMRPRGVVVQLGLGGDMNVPLQAMTAKELSLRGSFRFHEEFATGVSLMRKGLIDVRPYVTATYGMADAAAAFAAAGDRAAGIKTQIAF
ncbi:L-idonate 5-dehydrogenase [Jannaschia aquimarina]|uniref:IdnD protein n=1 Tax=Jannaschia aquimarina TaxID=935700 RepID=A0A0D1D546_9RHOB|nr:L-idonate 5-dehydrogenase [Jannaschia aquimarina]KIT15153.1 L-idonate 5-dehydrogenase (NAD(P)(+)) [Jannaschia aquimarina]SNT23752.1 L-idonate 5-dehydrogenase [Jannaschia aquimarina]